MAAVVRTRLAEVRGVRINWDYQVQSPDGQLYLTARVTLVAIDREKGKIMRQLPPAMEDALAELPSEHGLIPQRRKWTQKIFRVTLYHIHYQLIRITE